jgi:hypothetical protein
MSRKAKILIVTIPAACLLLAVAIPNFVRARQSSSTQACINNLRQIDEWKTKWELEPSTTNFQSGGFLSIESCIDRLFRSPNQSATVVVTTSDCPFAVLLRRQDGRTLLSVGPDPPDRTLNDAEETKIKEFFAGRGTKPIREVRSADPLYDHGRYGIEFLVSSDSKAISQLCVSLFSDLYGATDRHGVSVTTFGL